MDYHNDNKANAYNDLIYTAYLLCVMIFSLAVIFICNWGTVGDTSIYLYLNFTVLLLIALFLGAIGLFFLIKIKSHIAATIILSLVIFIFSFIASNYNVNLKILFILPIALTSLIISRKTGILLSLLIGTLLCLLELKYTGYNVPNKFLEIEIIFTGILLVIAWLIGSMAKIEKDARNSLVDLANRDGLTGLYNHKYFHVFLERLKDKSDASCSTVSIIFFDIDLFKYYNDTFGHSAGDDILSGIGSVLLRELNDPVVPARYGGDEFCVLLPGYGIAETERIAKKLKDEIERLEIKNINKMPNGKLTVTMGLANYPEHTTIIHNLVELADQALYKAKNTSKDKIELYYNVLDTLKGSCDKSEMELLSSIRTLLCVVNAKDRYTYGHSERVLEYSTLLANGCGLNEDEIRYIQYGAYLHDIGKIEIDINILNSTNRPSDTEWNILKNHPYWGSEIIRPIKSLEKVIPYVLEHHENYDGTGYPRGISGKEISLGARILRITDSFDAMTTDRPYKKGVSVDKACRELLDCAGSHYDPELCSVFVELIQQRSK